MNKKLSRRDFLKLAGITSAGFALSACGVKATELPTVTSMSPTGTPLPTETLTPTPTITPTSTPTLPLEQLPQTKQALAEFVQAFKAIGMDISTDQKGLEIRTITGKNKEQYEIAFVRVESLNGLEGDYPLMINGEGGEWESKSVVSNLFLSKGILFGFTYDMERNPYRKIVRPPDNLVGEYSKTVAPEDTFYQAFTFNNKKADWANIDEYLAFIDKYRLVSGPPHLYWAGNNHTSQNKEELIDRTAKIVEHCKESIDLWTINELFDDNGTPKDSETLANARAVIKTVRTVDPTAKVIINDNGMDWTPAKDNAYFNFVMEIMKSGELKEGEFIGYQGHNGIGYNRTPEQFANWFDKYAELGLNLRITEADIFDVKNLTSANEKKKAEIILNYYRAGGILEKKYGRKILDSIIVWGSTNNSSWLNDIGLLGQYPLLLDDNGNPYLSWYLIGKALFVE